MLRAVVVGAGSIGREFALRHLIEDLGLTVVAVVDYQLDLAKALAHDVSLRKAGAKVVGSKYRETVDESFQSTSISNVIASTDLAEVLDQVDLCYIGTPPNTHASLTLAALAAGKHVLLEKPIAVSDSDTERIVQAAEEAWREHKLVVNINIGMRFSEAAVEMRKRINENYLGGVKSMELRLLFRQWPREWQTQPWVAGRQQGGPLLEVGTHWIFGLLEIMGHDSVQSVDCKAVFADGVDGTQCEVSCAGHIDLVGGIRLKVDVQASSEEAQRKGQDIYELRATGAEGKSLVLYDFSRLRDGQTGLEILSGSYGRQECVIELVKAIRSGDRTEANLVTPTQAQNVQRIVAQLRRA